MKNMLEIKKVIENRSDLVIYRTLNNLLENRDLEYKYKSIATQIYKETIGYFNEYSENDQLTEKALEKLMKVDEEGFAILGIVSIYILALKNSEGLLLSENKNIKASKMANKNIQYLMNKISYYDYMLYMLEESENIGVSDSFREAIMNYLVDNESYIRENLIELDIFKGLEDIDKYLGYEKFEMKAI